MEYTDNGQPLKIFEQARTSIRTVQGKFVKQQSAEDTQIYTLGPQRLPVKTVKGLGREL